MPGKFCCGDGGENGPAVGGAAYMWCVTGDWAAYGCVFLVYFALISIDITVSLFCIRPLYGLDTALGRAHMAFFQLTVFMVVYCHLSASWTDPGLIAKDPSGTFKHLHDLEIEHAKELERLGDGGVALKKAKKRFCIRCSSFKPQGAHHCSLCNRCVRKMDHHCPWINNCVGERNWKAFFLFLCYVTIGLTYAVVLYVMRAYFVVTSVKPGDRRSPYSKNMLIFIIVYCMISCIMATAFLAFLMCMFYDQYEALTTGVPGVDAMQLPEDIPHVQSFFQGFKSMVVAGEPFSWRWFWPVAPQTLRRIAPPLEPESTDPAPPKDLSKWEAGFDNLGYQSAPGTKPHTTFAGRHLFADERAQKDEVAEMVADLASENPDKVVEAVQETDVRPQGFEEQQLKKVE